MERDSPWFGIVDSKPVSALLFWGWDNGDILHEKSFSGKTYL